MLTEINWSQWKVQRVVVVKWLIEQHDIKAKKIKYATILTLQSLWGENTNLRDKLKIA